MTFLLSSRNVLDYLVRQDLCNHKEQAMSQDDHKPSRHILSFRVHESDYFNPSLHFNLSDPSALFFEYKRFG
jgi:hypothetical protein